MNLNKTLGRVATTLVAGAMLTALAMPAYAETGVTGNGETEITQIQIDKTLYLPTGTTVPTLTYAFNIQPDTEAEGQFNGKIESTTVSLNVKPGKGGANSVNTVSFTSTDTATELVGTGEVSTGVSYVTKPVTLSLNSLTDFDDVGVYKYDITETRNGDIGSATVQDGLLDLYVYVSRIDDNYVITGAVVTEDGKATAKTGTIKNYYDVTPGEDGKDPVANKGSLSIKNTVTGKMGDYSEDFEYKITGLVENAVYNVGRSGAEVSGRPATITANENGEATIYLRHNETATIYGIAPAGLKVSANEKYYKNEGYTLDSVKVNGSSASVENYGVSVSVEKSKTAAVEFTNNRDAVSPTGIVMNVAPYVLLVVVAAAGCFVFLRKRRED